MVYITGDIHGDITFFNNPQLKRLTEKDILIVCGDFGFIWDPNDEKEKKNLEKLKKQKYTICFLDGAHENFDILDSYPPYRYRGGNTHKIADNIYHLLRGEIFDFDNKTFFVMGGGENLKNSEYKVNYILTYEAPAAAKDFLRMHTNNTTLQISILNNYLQELMKNVEYVHWYFGSLHLDLPISRKMTAVFEKIIPIK